MLVKGGPEGLTGSAVYMRLIFEGLTVLQQTKAMNGIGDKTNPDEVKFIIRTRLLLWCEHRNPTQNYANPIYGVAIICHQIRCLCWGHPSLFHTARSLLIWYKMFCMRDISYRLIYVKFINMLSMYAKSGMHRYLIDELLWYEHRTLLFWCVRRSPTPPNSSGNM